MPPRRVNEGSIGSQSQARVAVSQKSIRHNDIFLDNSCNPPPDWCVVGYHQVDCFHVEIWSPADDFSRSIWRIVDSQEPHGPYFKVKNEAKQSNIIGDLSSIEEKRQSHVSDTVDRKAREQTRDAHQRDGMSLIPHNNDVYKINRIRRSKTLSPQASAVHSKNFEYVSDSQHSTGSLPDIISTLLLLHQRAGHLRFRASRFARGDALEVVDREILRCLRAAQSAKQILDEARENAQALNYQQTRERVLADLESRNGSWLHKCSAAIEVLEGYLDIFSTSLEGLEDHVSFQALNGVENIIEIVSLPPSNEATKSMLGANEALLRCLGEIK